MESPVHDVSGRRAPRAMLAGLRNGETISLDAADLLGKGHLLVMWMPGAFTPVFSGQNITGLIANAVRLRKSGVDDIICIAASDPPAVDTWSKSVDPAGRIRFFADINLEFARMLGLVATDHDLLAFREGVIETSRVERHARGPQQTLELDV